MRKISKAWRSMTSRILDLPQDVVFDLPRVTMIGHMQLYVENHRGISHFTTEQLKLRLSVGELEISGKNLVIRAIWSEEVFIEGEVQHVQYVLPPK